MTLSPCWSRGYNRAPVTIRSLFAIPVLGLVLAITVAQAREWTPARLLAFADDSCRAWEKAAAPAAGYASAEIGVTDLRFGEIVVGKRYRLTLANNALVELDVVERAQRPVRFVASWFNESGDPLMLIALASDCSLQAARRLNYNPHGQALNIISLDADLLAMGEPDWLNPPLQFVERATPVPLRHPGADAPLRVAMVDSGVNYRLAEINRRLARDDDGQLIGYDFWEMDALPYDSHPINSGFFVQRHGTRSASLLLREAPGIELVPYRYPRPDMSRMHALVEHADANGVAIVGMPLGSNRAHPQMLFIVSAGNDGRDIDTLPVFPASLDLENILVVTSADDFVRPAERSNWGRLSVDFMVPAERRGALDYSGSEALVSGSSYAVSRVAALAARIKSVHRDWTAVEIIDALHQRYGQDGPDVYDWVGGGYIADPLASAPIDKIPLTDFEPVLQTAASGFRLDLEVLQLDPRWSATRIGEVLREAYRILAQCGIVPGDVSSYAIRADDYLLDLSTGSARSLLEAAGARQPAVVFARETRMEPAYLGEAFGIGNTTRRPWLANSVWLMLDVDDAGIALAHELYHVLANSGAHVEGRPNLMQPDTRPESTELTPQQCRLAQLSGVQLGLLRKE